jgi:hypothetical protein
MLLRTDASEFGVGGVLLQVFVHPDGTTEEQVIVMCSKKFSDAATRWCTIEQEAYGIFNAVEHFQYYLRGVKFIIETDHANLVWIEASMVPKIIRWRMYLQSFNFEILHIAGKLDIVADALFRLFMLYNAWDHSFDEDMDVFVMEWFDVWDLEEEEAMVLRLNGVFDLDLSEPAEYKNVSGSAIFANDAFDLIHNGQVGHWGAAESWRRLNKTAPGHGLSQKEVAELVQTCPNCMKNRRERDERLIPVTRSLKPPHSRSVIGIDAVGISPHGRNGQTHIYVVVNLFTKLTYLSAETTVSTQNLAATVWSYWANFGNSDMIISDLGSNLNSELFAELVKLMGIKHVFSIADSHANGSERTIKEVFDTSGHWCTIPGLGMFLTTLL